uniref:Uncharacterized protein n=1 Tax=Timema genevievae TaxID=629358 RepID=A0A7R9PLK7_TIMGE|nr:unnamed protein product [Timema genevievae]
MTGRSGFDSGALKELANAPVVLSQTPEDGEEIEVRISFGFGASSSTTNESYSNPMASLVLTDSSQLTSDSQQLGRIWRKCTPISGSGKLYRDKTLGTPRSEFEPRRRIHRQTRLDDTAALSRVPSNTGLEGCTLYEQVSNAPGRDSNRIPVILGAIDKGGTLDRVITEAQRTQENCTSTTTRERSERVIPTLRLHFVQCAVTHKNTCITDFPLPRLPLCCACPASNVRRALVSRDPFLTVIHYINIAENTSDVHAPMFVHGECDELKKSLRAIQEENYKLQAVITDVTEVNKRWQKYNNDRQMYVQRLLSTIQEQQDYINKTVSENIFPYKQNLSSSSDLSETLCLEEEVCRLRQSLETLEREHREHEEVLEIQLKAHRDDWEAERGEKLQAIQDKMMAESRIHELESEVEALRMKVEELTCPLKQFQRERFSGNGEHCQHCGAEFKPSNYSPLNCRLHNTKTYRTSGHFLPRGTTLYFSDDLTSDGVRKKSDSSSSSEELPRPRSHSVEEEILKFPKENSEPEDRKSGLPSTSLCQSNVLEKPQVSDGNNNVKTLFKERSSDSLNKFVPKATCSNNDNVATLNIVPENYLPRGCLPRKVSSSVLQISPTSSTSLVSEAHTSSDSGVNGDAGANAVSIGFSSNGLASVTTFSQIPIAKSFSLPLSQEVKNNNRTRAIAQSASDDLSKASSSRRKKSFYSTVWSAEPIVAPPSLDRLKNFSESSLSMDNNGKSLCSETAATGGSTTTMVNRKAPSWKSKYSEEGITTQTKEDVICPGCGKVFPPIHHLKFLDHFEACQSNS